MPLDHHGSNDLPPRSSPARGAFRCPIEIPAAYAVKLFFPWGAVTGETLNICHAGMLVELTSSRNKVSDGSRVAIALRTSSGLTRLHGTIRHTSGGCCGIEFRSRDSGEEFEPPLGLRQVIHSAQKAFLADRWRKMRQG
jgi:hypothetical protein